MRSLSASFGLMAFLASLAVPVADAEAGARPQLASRSSCKAKKKRAPKKSEPPSRKGEAARDSEEEEAEAESAGEAGDAKEGEEKKEEPPPRAEVPEVVKKAVAPRAESTAPAQGRKISKITPGTASRWSNKGAMTPIESEVPITVGLPERAIPVAPGVETPGQGLTGDGELLEARIHLAYGHLSTKGQSTELTFMGPQGPVTTPAQSRDIDLIRGRATIAYERIADSSFGFHLDLEYRPRLSGSRPTDHRLNEFYVSYGLTDFRRRDERNFGVAVGRLAVREAGYAQADGALIRFRLARDWTAGVFGGVSGNPYGYNWALRRDQEFSADWIRAGGFVGLRGQRALANFASVVTYSLTGEGAVLGSREPGKSGLDRLYLYADATYLATDTLNLMATGWIDVVGGHPFQSVELVAAYRPRAELDFRLGLGRFSTILYESTAAYSFLIDPLGNSAGPNGGVLVDAQGVPIVPFDAVLGSTIYNSLRARAGYHVALPLEVYANFDVLLRDTSYTDARQREVSTVALPVADLRLTPGAGVRYHDPEILDAAVEGVYIADDESQADASLRGVLGRGLYGLYLALDARTFLGEISASDFGADLSYTLPRDWFPGRVLARALFRYYRENLSLARPNVGVPDIVTDPNQFTVIPVQESYFGYFSLEWRL